MATAHGPTAHGVAVDSHKQQEIHMSGGWSRPDLSEINRQRTRHGMTDSPEHKAWRQIHTRCNNPKTPNFKDYGGRGIVVCSAWAVFETFLRDMGRRPSPAHSIERKNNNGPYSKDNCCWEIRTKQNQNTRAARWWTINGITYCSSADAARAHGVDQATIVRWCNGYRRYPPRPGCVSVPKYKETL